VAAKLRDVAREAGLSVATVSRFFNGRIELPSGTRLRIEDAARRLDYVPDAIARRLSAGASETLGLITTDVSYPFFAAIASAAEAEAAELGYNLAIFNSRNQLPRELQLLSRIADRQIDGALLLTNHADTTELGRRIARLGRVVLLDEDVPGAPVPRLFADNIEGGRLAAQHLLALGHKRVGFVGGPPGLISADERLAGFRAALEDGGAALDPSMVLRGSFTERFGREALARLLAPPRPPTAVFATADALAYGVLRAAREAGVTVPRTLSLVSFDDLPLHDLLEPPLTAIRQPAGEFGRRGVRILVDLIRGAHPDPTPQRVPVELVVRRSTARPAARLAA
jgi:LacI family transcriptional regulator